MLVDVVQVEELAEVEARVRQAIVKKDVVIANLREQLLTAHRQIKATEYLLQREHNAFVREGWKHPSIKEQHLNGELQH